MLKRTTLHSAFGSATLVVQPREGRTKSLVYLALIGARGAHLGSIVVDRQKLLDAINSTEEDEPERKHQFVAPIE